MHQDITYKAKKINMQTDLEKYMQEGEKEYQNHPETFDNLEINQDDLAAIIYTSGTTGIAKGVMLTHLNLCEDTCKSSRNLLIPGNSILVLPLHHTFAFTANVLCMLNIGHTTYINKSLKRISKDMMNYSPEVMFVVPMMVEAFYKKIWASARERGKEKLLKKMLKISNALLSCGVDARKEFFGSVLAGFGGRLQMIICGGAALDKKYVKAFREFGINLLNGYGITECSPIVSVNRNKYFKDGSVGPILEGIDVQIDHKDGEKEGEILVKGAIVMKGYYQQEEKTKEVMTADGYFRTGDIGYLDKDNFLYITGRVKNIIILDNGKNIYPEELELALSQEDAVCEVLVYEEEGHIVAEIYPDQEFLTEKNIEDKNAYFDELLERYNRKQPAYKQIHHYKLRDTEFEKTTTKKIKRKY